ncbi:MAG: N-acetyl-alpha-D-glucosaminyl L-malate synthase BshA [Vicinamibacteria bacterium]|nr:N-acetyl-alpha-D-glucosaminyl L-malate synthase BshA [Vicinamibacteria bacterium]
MRIGITCYPTVGGSGAVAAELGKQLARRGHSVHFVSYRLPFRLGGFDEHICFHEVDVTTYSLFEYPPHDLALAAKMAEVSRDQSLDLLHVHYAIPHAIAGFLAQQMLGDAAPRLVTTLHGTDITLVGQDRSFFEITRFGIERSNGVTAVSRFLARMTMDEFQVSRDIEVIPNFVDVSRHCANCSCCDRRALAPNSERILLHMSNFRPVKRVHDVIRVLERVNRDVPSVLLMVGDGPERASAQALARRLGVADRVRFLGRQDAVEEFTGKADLYLLPSELESFGLSALEAMACGVPVIGSDAGGLPEVVVNGETGFLVPVGDIESMAARARELLTDETRRREMGAAACRRVSNLFNAEMIVTQYERHYERVLAGTTKKDAAVTSATDRKGQ